MSFTITKKAYYLLYFSCFFALLLATISLVTLLSIPEHLQKWLRGGVIVILMWLNMIFARKGWLPPMRARTTGSESHTLRLGGITITVISGNARMTIRRELLFALAIFVWGAVVVAVMELFGRSEFRLPLVLLLMGATLAMIVNYAEKKWSNNLP
jgi:hypothetical protein